MARLGLRSVRGCSLVTPIFERSLPMRATEEEEEGESSLIKPSVRSTMIWRCRYFPLPPHLIPPHPSASPVRSSVRERFCLCLTRPVVGGGEGGGGRQKVHESAGSGGRRGRDRRLLGWRKCGREGKEGRRIGGGRGKVKSNRNIRGPSFSGLRSRGPVVSNPGCSALSIWSGDRHLERKTAFKDE